MSCRVAVVVLLAMGRSASADDDGDPDPGPLPVEHDEPHGLSSPFVTLLRTDGVSRADVDASYVSTDVGRVSRTDAFVQYVDQRYRVGGYATMAALRFDDDSDKPAYALGGLELGAVYVPKLPLDGFDLVAHAGLEFPTAERDGRGAAASYDSSIARINERYAAFRSWSLRVGVSPVVRWGRLVARLDASVDDQVQAEDYGLRVVIDLGTGVGYDFGLAVIMVELASTLVPAAPADFEVGALSVRFELGHLHPYAAVITPLDSETQKTGSVALMVGLSITPWEPQSRSLHLSHHH